MIDVALAAIGLVGPGLAGWARGAALLREPARWTPTPTAVPAPARLPATERRRAGAIVRIAVAAADEAVTGAAADPARLATVFASSTGDPLNCHLLCEALATPERLVSPTRFTNSVHNAPAGYWHIATHCTAASTSLAAFDASFGAGLLEAAVQCAHAGQPVLFVAADTPYPEPLHALRALADSFAAAFVLVPAGQPTPPAPSAAAPPPALARLRLAATDDARTRCTHGGLEQLRRTIPAAHSLPLLVRLAQGGPGRVVVEAADGWQLAIDVAAPGA
ncbi:MAG: beta-ketoacyl synthase chain length factor [Proteobacteria bacterium]|jgi:hypothetical protein|nr:beta-ketoacyl synthase chain length factor [Pseudomonadota bacterium]HOL37372.1 beta-ketoacyl synthase chain length factor [Rubrivivax sp.]